MPTQTTLSDDDGKELHTPMSRSARNNRRAEQVFKSFMGHHDGPDTDRTPEELHQAVVEVASQEKAKKQRTDQKAKQHSEVDDSARGEPRGVKNKWRHCSTIGDPRRHKCHAQNDTSSAVARLQLGRTAGRDGDDMYKIVDVNHQE